jgi:hypothetical protein
MDPKFSAIIYTYSNVQKHDEMIRYMFKTQNIFYIKQYTYIVEHTQKNVNAKMLQQLLILKV